MADGFDAQGARAAGYSDEEIAQHLAQSKNFDYQGAVKAGYSPQEIVQHLTAPPRGVLPPPNPIGLANQELSRIRPGLSVSGKEFNTRSNQGPIKTPEYGFGGPVVQGTLGAATNVGEGLKYGLGLTPNWKPREISDEMSPQELGQAVMSPFNLPATQLATSINAMRNNEPYTATSEGLQGLANTAGTASLGAKAGNNIIGAPSRMAPSLYRSALKPSTTIPPVKAGQLIETGLKERIPVSPAGLEKLEAVKEGLQDQVRDVIQSDPNRPINPNAVAKRADQVKPAFSNQVNAGQDLSSLEASKQQFLSEQGARPKIAATGPTTSPIVDEFGKPITHPGNPEIPAKPAPEMPAVKAQAMKQGTYTQLGKKSYGELKGADVEAQKALARGLKEELAKAFPELSDLNARESRLLNLEPVLNRAVSRIANRDTGIGIGAPILAGGTKAVTGSTPVAATVGALKAVIDNPNLKSRLAYTLYRAGVPRPIANARIAAFSTALLQGAGNANEQLQSSPAIGRLNPQ